MFSAEAVCECFQYQFTISFSILGAFYYTSVRTTKLIISLVYIVQWNKFKHQNGKFFHADIRQLMAAHRWMQKEWERKQSLGKMVLIWQTTSSFLNISLEIKCINSYMHTNRIKSKSDRWNGAIYRQQAAGTLYFITFVHIKQRETNRNQWHIHI